MTAILLGDNLLLEKELNVNWCFYVNQIGSIQGVCYVLYSVVLLFPTKGFACPIAAYGRNNQSFKILAALYCTSLYLVR